MTQQHEIIQNWSILGAFCERAKHILLHAWHTHVAHGKYIKDSFRDVKI